MREQVEIVKEGVKVVLFVTLIAAVVAISVRLNRVLDGIAPVNLAPTLAKLNTVADTVNVAAQHQDDYWTKKAGPELTKTGRAVRSLVDYTNKSLNEPVRGVLPSLAASATGVSAQAESTLSQVGEDADKLTSAAEPVLFATTHAVEDLDGQVSNPDIREAVGHFDHAALHLDNTLASVDATADYYHRKLTTPAGFAKTLALGALHLVTPATNVAIALK